MPHWRQLRSPFWLGLEINIDGCRRLGGGPGRVGQAPAAAVCGGRHGELSGPLLRLCHACRSLQRITRNANTKPTVAFILVRRCPALSILQLTRFTDNSGSVNRVIQIYPNKQH